jgi:hypothetical protein
MFKPPACSDDLHPDLTGRSELHDNILTEEGGRLRQPSDLCLCPSRRLYS